MSELRLMPDDLRECNYCARGSRIMADAIGVDWSDFLKNGVALSHLEPIDDAMIQVLITHDKNKNEVE